MSSPTKIFQAQAPGSLMLMGEYAVLDGKWGLVFAVNQLLRVRLEPRSDDQILIVSEGYGELRFAQKELAVKAPFHFVTACLSLHRKKLPSGCTIEIKSEFSDQMGFGSSAAVTVATLAALFAWLQIPWEPLTLIREARRVIRTVQGVGSGADVAASVLGGIIAYRAAPLAVEKFSLSLALTALYSGSKTKTVEAIRRVREKFAGRPKLYQALCLAIEQATLLGREALRAEDQKRLGELMDIQQGLMQALGVSTPLLDDLIDHLRADSAIRGAKISGSGYGDCVIGLGQAAHLGVEERYREARQIQMTVRTEGVQVL